MDRSDMIYNIDFNKDYYFVLGISKEDLFNDFEENSINNRKKNSQILHKAYREIAHNFHPDLAKLEQKEEFTLKFKEIIKAYTILSDPYIRKIYDNKSQTNSSSSIFIDWNLIGKFKKDSIENEIGNSIFISINENLNIEHNPFFVPTDEKYHNYIWEIEIKDFQKNLTLSLIPDEDEILLLTNGNNILESLPFKIYIFFPQINLKFEKEDKIAAYNSLGEIILFPGRTKSVKYEDHEFYAGTNLENTLNFIKSGELNKNIIEYIEKQK